MNISLLRRLAIRGLFNIALRAKVITGIALGLYTNEQLEELDQLQAQSNNGGTE